MKRLMISLIILMTASFMLAETIVVSQQYDNRVSLLYSNENSTGIEQLVGSFDRYPVEINEDTYYHLSIGNEPSVLEEGYPALPYVTSSIIIPDNALTDVRVISSDYTEYLMDIAPSKGPLTRDQLPSEIPYSFAEVYRQDDFYPGNLAELGEPYILRDFRGQAVRINPFQYNPVTGVLRVHHSITLEVNSIGVDDRNVKQRTRDGYAREFESVYQNRFLNFHTTRYTPIDERGRLIVIVYDAFVDATMPYVEWKRQKGIPTEVYPVTEIGNNSTAIMNFIQAEYDLDDGLMFVQLVGDAAQVATFTYGGRGSDPSYTLLEGNDPYPDMFIGRFSAESVAQVETQVERTVHYERDITTNDTWLSSAIGVASNEGAGIGHGGLSDIQHLNLIRDNLLDYTYVHVDQIYAPSATAAQVTTALNEGRGFGNYTGHGNNTSWGTTGFSNTHVNALTNDYMLPFYVSVACLNGNFTGTTCFAEAWLRATNNVTGAPTGALVFYASTRSQLWQPPMSAQQEITQLLVNDQKNTIGGLFFNGSCQMIDDYPSTSEGPDEFRYWHIFGDASLQVRSDIPQEISANHLNETFIGLDYFEVQTDTPDLLVSITHEGEILASDYTGADGNITLTFDEPPLEPMDLTLTITGYNKVTYDTTITVIPSEGPYVVIQEVNIEGSDDNTADYGDDVSLNVRLGNVGIETAYMVEATLMTEDPYITIEDNHEDFGHISPEGNVLKLNAFSLSIADNIPDQHRAYFTLEIIDNNDNTWTGSFNFLINAPIYESGTYTLDDSEFGDDNGYLDPGETVEITIPVSNLGNALSPETTVILVSGGPDIIITGDYIMEIDPIEPDDTIPLSFTLVASPEIEIGSVYNLGLLITGGEYEYQTTYILNVGPVIEDFETGDFTAHDWTFSGTQPWMIVSNEVYEGSYAARSGTITHSQSSSMNLTIDVAVDGEISFYRKVSSENNYDFFKFYINGSMVGQWSGEVPWSQVSYPVQAGTNTFTWTYEKDFIVSAGSDCAWVDFIEFPSAGEALEGPVFLANPVLIDFDVVLVDDIAVKDFWIRNFGNEEMTGTIETYEGFEISEIIPETLNGPTRSDSDRILYEFTIPPEGNIQYNLIFMPTEAMDYSGELLITSNSVNVTDAEISIMATGFILIPAEDLTLDLADDHVILTWMEPDFTRNTRGLHQAKSDGSTRINRDVEILGYNIYRDGVMINEEPVSDIIYLDYDIEAEETYTYYVTVVYNLGESEPSNEVEVFITSVEDELFNVPHRTELHANYPNPFNPSTKITFSIKERDRVQIDVYNVLGQKVKTLLNDEKEPGLHSVVWYGKDDSGRNVASGIYFYRMTTSDYNRTNKMIFLK